MSAMKSSLLSTTIATLLCMAAPAHAGETVERLVAADARGEVEIVNVSGDVQVLGWDRPEVRVRAELGSGAERLEVESRDKRTFIKVMLPGRSSSGNSDLVVHVPRESSLSINTISADQTIGEVRGAQRLQAVSGSITTQVWAAELSVKTISGDVVIGAHKQPAMTAVNTVSGDVRLENAAGELALETVTGDMDIRMTTLTRGRIRTTNGDLHLRTALASDARLDAEAINGDLRFALRNPIDAQFDIETFNGEIDNCFGQQPVRTREFAPGNELRFKQGAGSARVRIKTLNGGVEICKE